MIIDKLLLFSTAQAITTATAVSDNIIDLQNARDIGVGDNPAMKLFCYVTTAFATTDAGTLQVAIQGSTDASTWTTYALTNATAWTVGTLIAGAHLFDIDVPRPPPGASLPRYRRLNYVVVNHFTGGALTAGLVLDRNDIISYPSGYTVSN